MPERDLEAIYRHIDDHLDDHVARLQSWIQQRSISNTGEGMAEGAARMAGYFRDLGCQHVEIVDVGLTDWGAQGHPVVFAEYDAGAERTLLIYMMYDTMPVVDPEAWTAPPFEGRVVEMAPYTSVILGRGAMNSKGPEMAILNALQSTKAVSGQLPVNLVFVAEGDEERMSIGLRKFVETHTEHLRKVDAVMGWGRQEASGAARLVTGSEGCLYFELETSGENWGRGPLTDVHGGFKRIVDSPAWRHIAMLSTLVSPDGNRVLVDGWYEDIEAPSVDDYVMLEAAQAHINPEAVLRLAGIQNYQEGLSEEELFAQAVYGTTLNLDGIWSGQTQAGTAGSVLPARAVSKHNCRYVPNQSGVDLVEKLRDHLDRSGFSDVEIRVIGDVPWSRARYDTDICRAFERMYETFGVDVVRLPGPGVSMLGPYWPAYVFAGEPLNLPVILGGLGYGGRSHGIDEFYVIEGDGRVYGIAEAEKGYATVLYYYAESE